MSCRIRVKVVPGSAQNSIQLFAEGLKIKVTAAPEKGRANKAVSKLLADSLQLNRSQVSILSGHASEVKILCIEGLHCTDVFTKLGLNPPTS